MSDADGPRWSAQGSQTSTRSCGLIARAAVHLLTEAAGSGLCGLVVMMPLTLLDVLEREVREFVAAQTAVDERAQDVAIAQPQQRVRRC